MTVYAANRLWDGRAGAVQPGGFVRVEGGLITAVGNRTDLAHDAEITDLGDVTLMPGLINAHAHMTFSSSYTVYDDYVRDEAAGPATLALRAAANLAAAV